MEELKHYGVKGMRWGHRKARSQQQPYVSRRTQRLEKNLKETKTAIKEYSRIRDVRVQKIVNDLRLDDIKLSEKLKKSQYRDQYLSGKSWVGRMISTAMGTDKYYAEAMYNLRNVRD